MLPVKCAVKVQLLLPNDRKIEGAHFASSLSHSPIIVGFWLLLVLISVLRFEYGVSCLLGRCFTT
jgi:hypothetical protein